MKRVSVLALGVALALGAGGASAQTQPLPMPAPDTPALPAPQDIDYPGTIDLHVDATDLDRHIISVHEVIPVAKSGPFTLLVPKWLPGTHGPDMDMTKIAGIHISANGKELPWSRDNVAMTAFHVTIPEGVTEIVADFQYLAPVQPRDGVIVHTRNTMDLEWENESLYPAGYYTRRIPVKVTLTLPKDWGYGSALETENRQGDVVTFKPISYDNLVDSPLIAGRNFKRYDLDPGSKVPVFMDVVADYPEDLAVPDSVVKIQQNVVQEAYKLFGGWHYNHYDFLVAVSDQMGGIGLEHHRSSEDAVEPGYFTNVAGKGFGRNILPHEYGHSWDGKFRRPDGQFTADFEHPMRDELLWVYEGGTDYWGTLLESRAGLYSFDQRLQILAASAALYDTLPARQWRDLIDTTFDSIISNRGPKSWVSWQRSEDYYDEGAFIWLDADTLIREKTGDKKSLDDFAKAFFNVHNGSFLPAPYSFDDVVKTLNSVYPYDWATFLNTRLTRTGTMGAPLDGLARGGYKLIYTDTPSDYIRSSEARRGTNLSYSLGMSVGKDGTLRDVIWDGLAFKAGLTAGMKIAAVNDHVFDGGRLKDAITAAKAADAAPIKLLVIDGDLYRTVSFDYHGGLRYPKLVRIDGTPDRLMAIYQGDLLKSKGASK